MPELSNKEMQWFAVANAAAAQRYIWSRRFYGFKDRTLKRFGAQVGYDLQMISYQCNACGGSGMWAKDQTCNRCGGSGEYDDREVWLERWDLQGRIFHKPSQCIPPKNTEPVEVFEGLIRHGKVDSRSAYRCYMRLLLRLEPLTWWQVVVDHAQNKVSGWRWHWYVKLCRLRNRLELFPIFRRSPVNEDVPF